MQKVVTLSIPLTPFLTAMIDAQLGAAVRERKSLTLADGIEWDTLGPEDQAAFSKFLSGLKNGRLEIDGISEQLSIGFLLSHMQDLADLDVVIAWHDDLLRVAKGDPRLAWVIAVVHADREKAYEEARAIGVLMSRQWEAIEGYDITAAHQQTK